VVDWRKPWTEPSDRTAAEQSSDEYAWRLFVALNWPADPSSRVADPAVKLGADRPVVWETWSSTGVVYLEGGADPGPWMRGARGEVAAERRFETNGFQETQNVRHIVRGRMAPLDDPLLAARRLTEIRLNRTTFEYIRARQLYSREGQARAYADSRPVSFPYGAKEVKAKWRPIDASQRSRYHTTRVTFADGTQRLYGLTGLHIVSKDLPHWFWATFEHVDNPTLEDNEGWQLPSRDRFSCQNEAPDCNRAPTTIGLDGTVWKYYRLRGTMTRFTDAEHTPQLLANSELEAGLQKTASCMTCHSRSSIAVTAGNLSRLPIFDSVQGDEPLSVAGRRGVVGLPLPEWYRGATWRADQPSLYKTLDFVWSLANAKPRPGPSLTHP
jgi:hypothetical protein